MIKIQGKIPRKVMLAISGGVDSVAILDFLANNHEVCLVHFNHNEEDSDSLEYFVRQLAQKYSAPFMTKKGTPVVLGRSREDFWREQRYEFFHSLSFPVITCHHLNDVAETWVWSSLHGEGKIIPYANKNVIRPFRLTSKAELVNWAKNKELEWIEETSNKDMTLTRNYIRNIMMPHVLQVNPGIEKTIRKKVEKSNV